MVKLLLLKFKYRQRYTFNTFVPYWILDERKKQIYYAPSGWIGQSLERHRTDRYDTRWNLSQGNRQRGMDCLLCE